MAKQTVTIRCYYTDRMTGSRAGLARPADGKGAGYDWYEYSDGTLCHARRNM